ncbi:F-box protein CPR1-like [Rutidosis leptorrhynchoides]|uniref:F-box protein CPR1-like n=1 Tax=Rutidosis leptorrhynchoides TaxID=125765 RepID=UPI003A99A4F2
MASEFRTTLPPSIITNILCRLPAKSVGRFRLRHIIFNPTTKEVAGLPESGDEIIDGKSGDEIINIDSIAEGQIVYGFGYDSLTDDYKVVTISDIHRANLVNVDVTMHVHVYSLRANTWKGIIDTPGNHIYTVDAGVFSNGFLHWLEIKENEHLGNIIAFSLSDEKFNEILIPKVDFVYGKNCKLVDLGGKLALFMESKGEVWLMNEYGVNESWTKISLHGFDEMRMFFRPMIFDYDGKIMVVGKKQRFIYDVEGGFSENVEISHNHQLIVLGSYVESLVSLQSSQGLTEGTLNLSSGASGDPTSLDEFLQIILQMV